MSHFPDRLFRMALIGALAASLGLAACGRKGPLDPPPGAASATDKQEPGKAALMRSPFDRSGGSEPGTAGNQVSDRPFILDPLLN